MAPKVSWLGRASDRIEGSRIPLLTRELRQVFSSAQAVSVYDSFGGYSEDQSRKVVLGVEVRAKDSYHTHVVKIGSWEKVGSDYEGWRKCVLEHNFASRIFVSLRARKLPGERAAVVYEDAYQLFGAMEETQAPQSLESVIFWSVGDDKPDPGSVERVIRQIYTDLFRWFYRSPKSDRTQALKFYRRRLKRALGKWASEAWRQELRRDLVWLLCSHDVPDSFRDVSLLDPYDYISWAMSKGTIPQTLVGRSHGDLHGRNILVGVQRSEAEYPAVFDYGEMSDSNVLVWDFVKLESELKVRLLPSLYEDRECRETLLGMEGNEAGVRKLPELDDRPSSQVDPRSVRAYQLAFAYRFESILASLTSRIHRLADPEAGEPPGGRNITGNRKLDRALGILMRIRQEAALFLGDKQPQRGKRGLWRDEYYFGLAVYGLCTAKWDYKESESAFALVSAGVATAQCEAARDLIAEQIGSTKSPVCLKPGGVACACPSYRVPLAHAHRIWKSGRTRASVDLAIRILDCAMDRFGQCIPLVQEYVLLLAEAGRDEDALRMLGPLEDICCVFHDEETLCRVGRMCKDLGDRSLAAVTVASNALAGHSAWHWYDAAYRRYLEAFEIGQGYYPGVNAATLALMVGHVEESREVAAKVLEVCRQKDLSTLHIEDCFWVLVTEGECYLLLGKGREAATAYREAISLLAPDRGGMVQSVYNQVCRLAWAIGDTADPVVQVFRSSSFALDTGPLGDCRDLRHVMAKRAPRTRATPAKGKRAKRVKDG